MTFNMYLQTHVLQWHPLERLTIRDTPYAQSGVYFIKLKNDQAVLYIGSSKNLAMRIFANYLGGVGGETTKRIHKMLFEDGYLAKMEIGWIITQNFEKLEKELRVKFKKDHGKLPSWNKQS